MILQQASCWLTGTLILTVSFFRTAKMEIIQDKTGRFNHDDDWMNSWPPRKHPSWPTHPYRWQWRGSEREETDIGF